MFTVKIPPTPEVATTTCRLLSAAAAAALPPEDAADLDAQMFAEALADTYHTAAKLALFTPMLAARLRTTDLAAEQPPVQDAKAERAWEQLVATWERTIGSLPFILWQEVPR